MKEGMLWHDPSGERTLEQKIIRAAEYYNEKYGEWPTACFINPDALVGVNLDEVNVMGIEIRATRSVLKNHFWLGMLTN